MIKAILGRSHGMRALCGAAALGVLAVSATSPVHSHGSEARFVQMYDWKKEHFKKVFASNRSHLEGMGSNWAEATPRVIPVAGQQCVLGQLIGFDIDDSYAFDIDENVKLTVTYAAEYTTPFIIGWDRNGGTGAGLINVTPQAGNDLKTVSFTLDRARFAGQATQGADIAMAAPDLGVLVVCDVKIERTNTYKAPSAFGTFNLTVKDAKTGGLVPARIGLYDATGRAPLASDKSLMLQRFADDLRMLAVNERTFWPSANRQAFYVDSKYDAKIPVGTYELVATRGPEFKAYKGKVDIKAGQTSNVTISLERYADMPASGWYSGDSHIHVTRDEVADPQIWGFVAAEDVHVGNLLEMGNINRVFFDQPKAWGKESRFERDGHFIVSGQESPRTGFFGHTVHFNINHPTHLKTEEYFLYDKVFRETKSQGGLAGFAHMGWGTRDKKTMPASVNRGVVLLAPLGLVDFFEVLQGGHIETNAWYRMLNLGIRVKPAAGTDWPYSDFPGVVRFYAKVDGPFNLDNWFKAFNEGKALVTNGPLVDFTINGQGIGSELHVKKGAKLELVANAKLNPDVDTLDRMEVVIYGDVNESKSAGGKDRVEIKKTLTADKSMWVAVRAWGGRQAEDNMTIGHTAPIYVIVDDEPAWSREKLPGIVAELRAQLLKMRTEPYESPVNGNESWENREVQTEQWRLQRPLLKPRIDTADAAYVKLLENFSKVTGTPIAAVTK